jgi:ParB/RepB/Spo0J family partition protein
MNVVSLPVQDIDLRIEGHRPIEKETVARLADSIERIGLLNPIYVVPGRICKMGRMVEGYHVLTGAHRFQAVRQLGHETIDCVVFDGDQVAQRLREISENLHRAELSAVDRAEQIDEWRRLTVEKNNVHDEQKSRGRPSQGHSETAEALGVSRVVVQRAEQIASLPQDVRDQARAEDWTQKRLLEVAKPRQVKIAADPLHDMEALEAQVARLMTAWNAASPEARAEFLLRIDTPVFDNTRAA